MGRTKVFEGGWGSRQARWQFSTVQLSKVLYKFSITSIANNVSCRIENRTVQTGVQVRVVAQVREFGEATRAQLAFEWPISWVHILVVPQVSRRRERLGAVWAFMRFFRRVSHPVIVEIRRRCEPLPTHWTLMRLFTCDVYSILENTIQCTHIGTETIISSLTPCSGPLPGFYWCSGNLGQL